MKMNFWVLIFLIGASGSMAQALTPEGRAIIDNPDLADDAVSLQPAVPTPVAPKGPSASTVTGRPAAASSVSGSSPPDAGWASGGSPRLSEVEQIHESREIIKAVDPMTRDDRGEGARGVYLAPQVGSMSLSNSNGSSSRSNELSYGVEGGYVFDHLTANLNYDHIAPSSQGNSSVSVGSTYDWYSLGGRYLVFDEWITPFVSGDAGVITQTITTQVLNANEKFMGNFFIYAPGLGVSGRINSFMGFAVGAKYYQFSNVNGFYYSLSLGFFPEFF